MEIVIGIGMFIGIVVSFLPEEEEVTNES